MRRSVPLVALWAVLLGSISLAEGRLRKSRAWKAGTTQNLTEAPERDERLFSLFSIVQFKKQECTCES